ncbi:Protein Shroom3 [Camelus dromedarius]|uniref:Protein Shroom3 n=1 Tax=Camelus dromedarius TaxID=9838 RepID=A0A5N4CAV7_CAMDR|nr:Protein Shroom3 [Camelus dromedarius]
MPRNFGKTKPAFSSLQNIPESLRRQSSLDLGGGAQDVHLGGRPTCAVNARQSTLEGKLFLITGTTWTVNFLSKAGGENWWLGFFPQFRPRVWRATLPTPPGDMEPGPKEAQLQKRLDFAGLFSEEAPGNSLGHFPPPPPQAMFQVQWDSEGCCEPHTSSYSKLAKVTVAKERPMPGAAHLEDIRTKALAKEIVQDKSLADILDPDSRMKTTMDLMEGLFPRDINLMQGNSIKKKVMQRTVSFPGSEAKRSEDKEAVGMLSAPKAGLLNKIKDMPEEVNEEEEPADVNEEQTGLIGSLTHKLEILQEVKGGLMTDPSSNILSGLGEDASHKERRSLNQKRKVLAGQHEDAQELKENLDRREHMLLDILANYVSEEQPQDYQHFVKMKPMFLIGQ